LAKPEGVGMHSTRQLRIDHPVERETLQTRPAGKRQTDRLQLLEQRKVARIQFETPHLHA
jgi:hypothetical protein